MKLLFPFYWAESGSSHIILHLARDFHIFKAGSIKGPQPTRWSRLGQERRAEERGGKAVVHWQLAGAVTIPPSVPSCSDANTCAA